jgi:hypothetical protein
MIYKQKVQGQIDVLVGKIKVIEAVAKGAMQLPNNQVLQVIEDTKKVIDRINELVNLESLKS